MSLGVDFNGTDIVAGLVLLGGFVRGWRRGLSGELARLAGVAVALWAGWRFHAPIGLWIYRHTRLAEQGAYALAFVVAVGAGYLTMLAVRVLLRQLMEFTFKGKLERWGGGLCGLAKSAVAVAAAIVFLSLVPAEGVRRAVAEASWVGRLVQAHVPPLYARLAERYPALPDLWPGAWTPPERAADEDEFETESP